MHTKLLFIFLILSSFWSNRAPCQWRQAFSPDGSLIGGFSNSESRLYVAASGGTSAWVLLSTDNGVSWQKQYGALPVAGICALAVAGNNLYAALCEVPQPIARSTDEGENWIRLGSGLSNDYVTSLAVLGTTVFAGTYHGTGTGGGVFRSTDSGATWKPVNNGLTPEAPVYRIVVNRARLYVRSGSGIFVSNDSGNTWSRILNNGAASVFTALAVDGARLIVNDYSASIFFSANNGLYWRPITAPSGSTYLGIFVFDGPDIFACGSDAGAVILMSTDSGQSWENIGQGAPDRDGDMTISGPNLILGTNASGIWYRPLSDFGISSVKNSTSNQELLTLDAFPDPTPSRTMISFTLRDAGEAILTLTDAAGRETPLLHSAWMDAGKHETVWDASHFPNGLYLCRLEANGKSATMRMVVRK